MLPWHTPFPTWIWWCLWWIPWCPRAGSERQDSEHTMLLRNKTINQISKQMWMQFGGELPSSSAFWREVSGRSLSGNGWHWPACPGHCASRGPLYCSGPWPKHPAGTTAVRLRLLLGLDNKHKYHTNIYCATASSRGHISKRRLTFRTLSMTPWSPLSSPVPRVLPRA